MPAKIVNLCPHDVVVLLGDRSVRFPPSGIVARCEVAFRKFGYVDVAGKQVPMERAVFGAVEGLPAPAPRTWYIVSSIVANAAPHRSDLLVPYRRVRAGGRVQGCLHLAQVRAQG